MLNCSKKGMLVFACALLTFSAGCGGSSDQPDLGVGRAAAANTDAEGNYTLQYLDGVEGCKLGPNTVGFDWPPGATNAVGIPAKYNGDAAFKFDVKAGSNTFDLKMESDGSPAVKPLEQ
jgi:hypothetical protein